MKKRHIQKEELLLYCMDELSVKRASRIRFHLKECTECRNLLTSEQHFVQLLKQHPKPEPTEILLNRCRTHFKKTMRNQIHSSDSALFWKKLFDRILIPTPRVQIATAALFFIIGLALGRFLFLSEKIRSSAGEEMIRALQTGSAIENYSFCPPNRGS
jgi:hypothetical protein